MGQRATFPLYFGHETFWVLKQPASRIRWLILFRILGRLCYICLEIFPAKLRQVFSAYQLWRILLTISVVAVLHGASGFIFAVKGYRWARRGGKLFCRACLHTSYQSQIVCLVHAGIVQNVVVFVFRVRPLYLLVHFLTLECVTPVC